MERVSGNEKPEVTLDLLLMRGLLIGGEREKVGHVDFFWLLIGREQNWK